MVITKIITMVIIVIKTVKQQNNRLREYQKVIKLLDDARNQLSKFRTANPLKTNDES